MADIRDFNMSAGEIFRKKKYEHKLHRIRRLKRKTSKIKPALRSLDDSSEAEEKKEHRTGSQKKRDDHTGPPEKSPVNETRDEENRERDRKPEDLPVGEIIFPSRFRRQEGIHRHKSGKGNQKNSGKKNPVNLENRKNALYFIGYTFHFRFY